MTDKNQVLQRNDGAVASQNEKFIQKQDTATTEFLARWSTVDATNDVDFDKAQHSKGRSKMSSFPPPEIISKTWQQAKQPRFLIYNDHNLFVKVGTRLKIIEAIAQHFAHQHISSDGVSVPEVYGWRVREECCMIYMQYCAGPTLMDVYDTLTLEEKHMICQQLGLFVQTLRDIQREPYSPLVGSVNHGPVQDFFFRRTNQIEEFSSVAEFHDFLSETALPATLRGSVSDPYRESLPDDCKVFFTHADLTPTNIIMTEDPGHRRVNAIIDWEQAGWYPEYWEYCKLHLGHDDEHEWRAGGWTDKIMQNYQLELWAISEYYQARPP